MKARRWWAWPLVPVYAAGLAVKDALRAAGVLPTRRLPWPVVSVGSLSAGGAGKTPVVIALAELLRTRSWDVDVLSRGYGREDSSKKSAEQVMPEIEDAAARFGDEPVLIARRTGVPVWVCADRFLAGKSAEDFAGQPRWKVVSERAEGVKEAGPFRGVHLLDDGFQHRRLARAMDVVLVTAEDLEDALLPAGNRREQLRALRRADVVVVREEELAAIKGAMAGWMRADARIWVVRRRLRFGGVSVGEHTPGAKAPSPSGAGERPETEASGYPEAEARATTTAEARAKAKATEEARGEAKAGARAGERVVGFCGIARPEGFWGMLEGAGCEVVGKVAFGDHHRYGMVDVERVVTAARECGAAGFVTTEKDAVKLTKAMRERLEAIGPLEVVGLDVTFLDEGAVVRDLERSIGKAGMGNTKIEEEQFG